MESRFKTHALDRENVRVELDWIGEGYCGDYDPEDPEDEPLLRFYVLCKDENGSWEPIDGASACTLLPAMSTEDVIGDALKLLMERFYPIFSGYPKIGPFKRAIEEMSYLNPGMIEEWKASNDSPD